MIISEGGQERYCTYLTNEHTAICSDVLASSNGEGEYFGPYDLICSGIASCLNITARMLLERMEITYEKVVVKVDMDFVEPGKTKFIYDVDIIGDIDEVTREYIMENLTECPIQKTLSSEIEFEALDNV